jgi:hypothetical protein
MNRIATNRIARRALIGFMGIAASALLGAPILGQSLPRRPAAAPDSARAQAPVPPKNAADTKPPGTAPPASRVENPSPPDKDVRNCLSPGDLDAQDSHVARNAAALASSDLCIKMDEFQEGGLRWALMIIENKRDPDRIFWVVPHDNEDDAFDNAVAAVTRYRGTVVAVKTNGTHYNGLQDPNRNFDVGSGGKCRKQLARSPIYTQRVMRWHRKGAPIVALHTNELGYKGDGKGGLYGISMAQPVPGTVAFRAKTAPLGASPDDTMVFVASLADPEHDPGLMAFVDALRNRGINVIYETVSPDRNDCSMSNYATLKGMRDYVNIEVVRTDGETQRQIVDLVMSIMGDGGIRKGPAKPNRAGDTGERGGAPQAAGR